MVDPQPPHLRNQDGGLQEAPPAPDGGRRQGRRCRADPPAGGAPDDTRQRPRRACELSHRAVRKVDDGHLEVAQEPVSERLLRPGERKNRYPLALSLQLEQLGGNKRLRYPGEPLQDVADVHGGSTGHGSGTFDQDVARGWRSAGHRAATFAGALSRPAPASSRRAPAACAAPSRLRVSRTRPPRAARLVSRALSISLLMRFG